MLTHYRDLARQFRKLILAGAFGAGALSCLLSLAMLEAMPLYRSAVTLNLQPSEEALRFNDAFLGVSQLNPADIITQAHIERLLSRPVAERALDILIAEGGGLVAEAPNAFERLKAALWRNWALLNYGYFEPAEAREEALDELMEAIDIEVVAGSYILMLEITHEDPDLAARAANALARAYMEVSGADFAREAAVVDEALAALQSRTESELASHLTRRRKLERELGFESVDDGRAILLAARTEARRALVATQRRVDALRERLERAGDGDPAGRAALEAQLREAEVQRSRRREAVGQAEAGLEALDRTETRLVEVDQKIDEAQGDLEELQRRRISAELARKARLNQVRVIEAASAPTYPAFPKVLLNTVVGTLVGMLLAMAPVAALDVLDGRIRTAEDLRRAVGARALPTASPGLFARARRFLRRGRAPDRELRRYAEAMGRQLLAKGRPRWPEGPVHVTAFGSQADAARLHSLVAAATQVLVPTERGGAGPPQVVELPKISHLSDWSFCRGATLVIGVAAGEAEHGEVESAAAAATEAGAAAFFAVLIP